MKRFILSICIIASISLAGYSQIKFGLRGGLNWGYFKAKDIITNNQDYSVLFDKKVRSGYHFGLISQMSISKLFIQPELLYTLNKSDVSLENNTSGNVEQFVEQKIHRIDIPVLVGLKFGTFKAEVGPVGTFLLKNSLSEELEDYIADFDPDDKAMSVGYQVGIGIERPSLNIELKYEGALGKFADSVQVGQEEFNFDSRVSQIILTIGLFLND